MTERTNRIVAAKRELKRFVDEVERERERARYRVPTLRPDPPKSLPSAAVILAAAFIGSGFILALFFALITR